MSFIMGNLDEGLYNSWRGHGEHHEILVIAEGAHARSKNRV